MKKSKKTNKYYMNIYTNTGYFFACDYGDYERVKHYLKQGYGVAVFEDVKLAIDDLNFYKKAVNE